jgi:hypothetical protein
MMKTQMASSPAQVHPIHIQLQGFLAHFLGVCPGLGVGCVLDLAEHAAIALAATVRFSSSVLTLCSVTFGTLGHAFIIAQFLATPVAGWKGFYQSRGLAIDSQNLLSFTTVF